MQKSPRGLKMLLALLLPIVLISGPGLPEAGDESADNHVNDISRLSFLAGSWIRQDGLRRSEEHWTIPAGGTMIGMNRTVIGGRTTSYEYLRIEQTEKGIDYVAVPIRQEITRFRLIECTNLRAVFENPKHDFPNRIIYERSGDKLTGAIVGTRGGNEASVQWEWTRGALSDQ